MLITNPIIFLSKQHDQIQTMPNPNPLSLFKPSFNFFWWNGIFILCSVSGVCWSWLHIFFEIQRVTKLISVSENSCTYKCAYLMKWLENSNHKTQVHITPMLISQGVDNIIRWRWFQYTTPFGNVWKPSLTNVFE